MRITVGVVATASKRERRAAIADASRSSSGHVAIHCCDCRQGKVELSERAMTPRANFHP